MRVMMLAAFGTMLVSGCADPRTSPPNMTIVSSMSLNNTSACLVRELNDLAKPRDWDVVIRYHVRIIAPEHIHEVATQNGFLWFVRVTAIDGNKSKMELFAGDIAERFQSALPKCA